MELLSVRSTWMEFESDTEGAHSLFVAFFFSLLYFYLHSHLK